MMIVSIFKSIKSLYQEQYQEKLVRFALFIYLFENELIEKCTLSLKKEPKSFILMRLEITKQ
jgi:hypothetical protein